MSPQRRSIGLGPVFGLAIVFAITAAVLPARATRESAARLCIDAARIAAERSGVPFRVLLALSLTETGRAKGDDLMPWPWAVNQGGQSLWFDSRDAAASHVRAAIAGGESNLDLGCFQINWGWHGANFDSVDAMLVPLSNADYAAALMARHHRRSGSWRAAVAAYHSTSPELAARYLTRFEPIYDSLGEGDDPDMVDSGLSVARAGAASANGFPLLLPGPTAGLGSLVPVVSAARPLIEEN